MLTLYVKRLTGKTGTIEVNSNDTIKKGKSLNKDGFGPVVSLMMRKRSKTMKFPTKLLFIWCVDFEVGE